MRKRRAWQRGPTDMVKGYLAPIAGAAAATLVLRRSGTDVLGGESYHLPERSLLHYWSSVTISSVLASVAAGAAGAILLYTERTILTLAAMIALALVPGAGMIGLGLAGGSLTLGAQGLLRGGIDVAAVPVAAWLVFRGKLSRLPNRRLRWWERCDTPDTIHRAR